MMADEFSYRPQYRLEYRYLFGFPCRFLFWSAVVAPLQF